ncbi:MAG: DNA repair exonuclease [Planctomycetia bacterium]|nr:DNA repair exonuclease [Planctomycetia bacterium]
MSTDPVMRFVHASDLHLEQPPYGMADVPEHWREKLVEAPYQAATRVFDLAAEHSVDLVVLAGDVVDWRAAGPRGSWFLVEQFRRLADLDIPVYWAGGGVDPPDRWPDGLALPDNVHRFAAGRVEEHICRRRGKAVARIAGTSRHKARAVRAHEFHPDPDGLLTIAVAHGTADEEPLRARQIHYWALGGQHSATTLFAGKHVAHWSGSPQARQPLETGPHGCTLVEVDPEGRPQTKFLPTDVLRWQCESLTIDDSTDRDLFELLLHDKLQTLLAGDKEMRFLVSFSIHGRGPLLRALRREGLDQAVLKSLRETFGQGPGRAWSVSITAEPPAAFPESWYEEETFLGDFLRGVRAWQAAAEPIDLSPMLGGGESGAAGASTQVETLRHVTLLDDPHARRKILDQVVSLGVDVLGGKEKGA